MKKLAVILTQEKNGFVHLFVHFWVGFPQVDAVYETVDVMIGQGSHGLGRFKLFWFS